MINKSNNFTNITTPEEAYILGLIWADGYITKYTMAIEIIQSDLEPLEHMFNKTGQWIKKLRTRKNWKPQISLRLNDSGVCEELIKNGYKSKSEESADKILSKIPEHLQHYWFRGLVDGDGCFYHHSKEHLYQITIASSYNQNWSYLEKLCNQLNIKYKIQRNVQTNRKNKIHKSSKFRITNKKDLVKFADYIYENCENDKIGFARKYQKFQEIQEHIRLTRKELPKGISRHKNGYFRAYSLKSENGIKQKEIGLFRTFEEAIEARKIRSTPS